MSDQSLAAYVDGLLRQGYAEAEIRAALAQRGYPQSLIDAAFRARAPGRSPKATASSPARSSSAPPSGNPLVSYLRTYLAQGYRVEQLKPLLLRQGYAARDVDAALAEATGERVVRHELRIPTATILAVLLLVAAVAGAFVAFSALHRPVAPQPATQPGSPLLDVKLGLDAATAAPGGTVRATASLTNMGTASRYDVTLTFRLVDGDGVVIAQGEETRALATTMDVAHDLAVPQGLADGAYTVRVVAAYGDGARATASAALAVRAQQPAQPPEEPSQNASLPTQPRYVVLNAEQQPDAQAEAVAAAKRGESAQAESLCTAIENQARRDACLGTIVLSDQQPSHCAAIVSDEERDTCYMPFVLQGDYALCAKLTSPDRQDLCANLQRLGASQAAQSAQQPSIDDYATPS